MNRVRLDELSGMYHSCRMPGGTQMARQLWPRKFPVPVHMTMLPEAT
ncbi:MAG: hypothetical protein V8Q84_01525 [Bilophila sp.]